MPCIQFNFKVAIRRTKILLLILISSTLISTIWKIVNVITDWNNLNNDDQFDQQKTLITMSIIMLGLIILICLFGYIGVLKQSYWITVIFAIGLTIVWISTFSNWTMFTYFFISCHIFIIGTIISACFFAKFLRKQNQVAKESDEINSNSHVSSEPSTTPTVTSRQRSVDQTNGQIFFTSNYQDPIPGCSYFVSREPPPAYDDIYHDQSDSQLNFQHQEFVPPIETQQVLAESIRDFNFQNHVQDFLVERQDLHSQYKVHEIQCQMNLSDVNSQIQAHKPAFYKY